MSSGEYSENLPCGGRLSVRRGRWDVTYYFPGRDRRHKGESITIASKEIKDYIKAYVENWNEYQALKKTVPPGGDFSKKGKLNMMIRLGKFGRGVCIRSYHMPLSTKEDVQKVIDSYKYAMKRAPQIQQFLAEL